MSTKKLHLSPNIYDSDSSLLKLKNCFPASEHLQQIGILNSLLNTVKISRSVNQLTTEALWTTPVLVLGEKDCTCFLESPEDCKVPMPTCFHPQCVLEGHEKEGEKYQRKEEDKSMQIPHPHGIRQAPFKP